MEPKTRHVTGYVLTGIAAALGSGLLVWAAMGARLDGVERRARDAEDRVLELEATVAASSAPVPGPSTPGTPSTQPSAGIRPQEPVADAPPPTGTSRRFCFVRGGSWSSGPPVLSIDYAEMLSGEAAAAAARARGEESPPPNDYYILNDDMAAIEVPADSRMAVTLVSTADGVAASAYQMRFGEWFDVLVGMSGGDFARDRPYWVTVSDGTITALEEQYLP